MHDFVLLLGFLSWFSEDSYTLTLIDEVWIVLCVFIDYWKKILMFSGSKNLIYIFLIFL